MNPTRKQRRNTPIKFAVFVKAGQSGVGKRYANGRMRPLNSPGFGDPLLSKTLIRSLWMEADVRQRLHADTTHPLVAPQHPGCFGLAGVFDSSHRAVFASDMMGYLSRTITQQVSGPYLLPNEVLGAMNWKQNAPPTVPYSSAEENTQRVECELRERILITIEQIAAHGAYTGLDVLTSGSTVDILEGVLRGCRDVAALRESQMDDLRRSMSSNEKLCELLTQHWSTLMASSEPDPAFTLSLAWLAQHIPHFYLCHQWEHVDVEAWPEKTRLLAAMSLLGSAIEHANGGQELDWEALHRSSPALPEVLLLDNMIQCVEHALEAARLWKQLDEKRTPLPWTEKMVRNRTGLEMPQDRREVMFALREKDTESWIAHSRSGRKMGRLLGKGGYGRTHGMQMMAQYVSNFQGKPVGIPYVWGGGTPPSSGLFQQIQPTFRRPPSQGGTP